MAQSPGSAENVVDLDALGELNNAEARALFDMVDKLSALGVGKIVDLPQIIVVGDQSAGKSTVLGAISQVRFPVHGGVCTRFATELALSPSPRRHVEASVRFKDSSKPAHTLRVDDFDQRDIQQIIATARDQMGLSETSREYSKDVLRLELEGPEMCHLTLVDLPGIYHNETDDQSPEGIQVVMDIVTSYMKKSNSIILAIISASGGFANQAVMREAAKHDPARERTLGVVTKPDLLPVGSDLQKDYLQLVRNAQTTHKLKLGWHMVRNRADYEGDRPADAIEDDFFRTGPWASIPASGRGITALRKRLSKLLYEHIKKSLPTVIKDIQHQLSERQGELSRLGQPRSTPAAMRLYLTAAAERFQGLIVDGSRGHYLDPFFGGFEEQGQKLRAQLRNWNRAIRYILLTYGSVYDVVEPAGRVGGRSRRYPLPPFLADFVRRDSLPLPKIISRAELARKLESQAAVNQGTEYPGYPNMGLATQLFQEQTKQWVSLAAQHLEEVVSAVRDFIEHVVLEVTGPSNERTRNAILSAYVEPFFDAKHDVLIAKLQEILRPFKESYALALDDDFQDALRDMTTRREVDKDLRGARAGDAAPPNSFAAEQARVGEFGTEHIVDTVQVFYEMSLRTFTDNLVNLVIESCLVRELTSIFSASLVATMNEEQLSSFASEEDGVANYRSQLQTEISLLKEGLELCRRNMPRNLKGRTTNSAEATQSNRAADPSGPDTLDSRSSGPAGQASSSGAPPLMRGGLVSRPTTSAPLGRVLGSTAPASIGVTSTHPTGSSAQPPEPSSAASFGNPLLFSSSNNTGFNPAPSGRLFGGGGAPSTAKPAAAPTGGAFGPTRPSNNTGSGNATSAFGGPFAQANEGASGQGSSIFGMVRSQAHPAQSNNEPQPFGSLGKASE
ncbi:dynamin family protein [Plectosphaerella cucumerina]|uniref:Dynamin family protein n=1 Tax=Plectosphaerella cucumerina TaxID=40658 RepID=A0A8K0T5C7_9PEZI|nr:dynamin family protein [Plectosphaerella cucumerina]